MTARANRPKGRRRCPSWCLRIVLKSGAASWSSPVPNAGPSWELIMRFETRLYRLASSRTSAKIFAKVCASPGQRAET